MKIKTTYTIFLAASLVGGISCQRLLQGVPQTGLDATAPVDSADPAQVTDGTGVEKQLVQSLEADPQVAGKTKPWSLDHVAINVVNSSTAVPNAVQYNEIGNS